MGISGVEIYHDVVWAKKDLLMVCNGHQGCGVMSNSRSGKEKPDDHLQWVSGMCGYSKQ